MAEMEDYGDAAINEKEEYYRKLNESLKMKAASLISQAENALKEQSEMYKSCDLPAEKDDKKSGEMCSIGTTGKRTERCGKGAATSTSENHCQKRLSTPESSAQDNQEQSDSEESLVEAFDGLETPEDVEGTSASSVVSKALSSAAQARLYQAKLRVAKSEIQRLKAHCEKVSTDNSVLSEKCRECEKEQQTLKTTSQKYSSEISRLKKALEDTDDEVQRLRTEGIYWKKEVENRDRLIQSLTTSKSQLEVKIKRVNEELAKIRLAVEAEKLKGRELGEVTKEKVASLEASNKMLEKQKQELIVGFKKQARLIDVLKRQKLYLEGAKLLQISEQEFLKAVDLNLND